MRAYLCVGVISIPGSSEGLLTAQIPHDEVDVLPNNFFHIRAYGGRCVYNLIHEELIQDGGLPCII